MGGVRVRDAIQAEPDCPRAILDKDLNIRLFLPHGVQRQIVMLVILLAGTDDYCNPVFALVVEADPCAHYRLEEEIELLFDPLLKLLTFKDNLLKVFKGLNILGDLCLLVGLRGSWLDLNLFFAINVHIKKVVIIFVVISASLWVLRGDWACRLLSRIRRSRRVGT